MVVFGRCRWNSEVMDVKGGGGEDFSANEAIRGTCTCVCIGVAFYERAFWKLQIPVSATKK